MNQIQLSPEKELELVKGLLEANSAHLLQVQANAEALLDHFQNVEQAQKEYYKASRALNITNSNVNMVLNTLSTTAMIGFMACVLKFIMAQ